MTAREALAEIKELVERRQIEPEEWYRTICAVREIVGQDVDDDDRAQ